MVEALTEPYELVESFDRNYATKPDHWDYTTNPIELERFAIAVEMLDDVRNGKRFTRAMEIACAEGVFTERLAPMCDSLLAVDFSEIALARAQERCERWPHVTFERWNLRSDPMPGSFDLLLVMDVLTLVRRPHRLRRIVAKLVNGMRSGDLMLACDFREEPSLRVLENSWVGRRLLFGGKWVIESLVARSDLIVLKRASTDSHLLALLQKR
jgi:predicted TPR repeat methyltransferase